MTTQAHDLAARFGPALDTRWASLDASAQDFGHLVRATPLGVLRPGSAAEIKDVLEFAGPRGIAVSVRGGGHSMYGQGQAGDGIVLDLRGMRRIGPVTDRQVTVQAGALWREVLAATLPHGLTPPVLTDYLGASVGGVLSAGGLGGATHRHGLVADQVLELEVVTGAGDHRVCSPDRDPALWGAVLAGLGQCAVIVAATLRLAPAPDRVRRHCLYYTDLTRYLADQRMLAEEQRFGHLEGQARPADGQGWQYMIEAVVPYDGPCPPDDGALLAGLGHDPAALETEDLDYPQFAHRVDTDEEILTATGEWLHPHPWLNLLLPHDSAESVVRAVLADPAFQDLRDTGLVLLYPLLSARLRAPLFTRPPGQVPYLFALLRTAAPGSPETAAAMVAANRAAYELARSRGAVAYPVNALPMSDADWRDHYGSRWSALADAKRRHDPCLVLARGHGLRF
ncbi:FAD-binding protein [Streptomyces broussonetiae]|uniref:FAD-binding protein n=1 Tax=Streptomyces broussonetiae TaxID=2686304 RepID=A0A6I6NL53_9ACTN|nr:FAD-binding protein [Streptomyces broussonetiae]QHA08637.1 FAD-binding protein [Streptomyces broussonetiae]